MSGADRHEGTATEQALVTLYISFPISLEEEIIDFCHEHAALAPGFTLLNAEGFGAAHPLRSTAEAVMGRARRRLLLVVLAQEAANALLAELRRELPSHDVVFWLAATH